MNGTIVLIYLVVSVGIAWLFYKWGAHISEQKGRPRALGWWAVFFSWAAIIVLYLLPDQSGVGHYAPAQPAVLPKANVSAKLERLASLREKGALTQEEFEKAKAEALASG